MAIMSNDLPFTGLVPVEEHTESDLKSLSDSTVICVGQQIETIWRLLLNFPPDSINSKNVFTFYMYLTC